jgi:hypothetical protein
MKRAFSFIGCYLAYFNNLIFENVESVIEQLPYHASLHGQDCLIKGDDRPHRQGFSPVSATSGVQDLEGKFISAGGAENELLEMISAKTHKIRIG